MANDLNLCQFIGRLGADPEVRYTQGGKTIANIRLAVGQSWKDQSGQKQEKTEWVNVACFGKLAEIVEQYLAKGSKVYVSGRMQTRKWQDKEGQDRYTTEIVASDMQMLDDRKSSGQTRSVPEPGGDDGFDDSEIPF